MSLYNTTWMNTATNPVDIVIGIGTSVTSEYLMGNLILLTFFLIVLVLSIKHNFLEVLLIDGFVTTIIAIFLFYGGMIASTTIAFPAVLFFITIIFFFFS